MMSKRPRTARLTAQEALKRILDSHSDSKDEERLLDEHGESDDGEIDDIHHLDGENTESDHESISHDLSDGSSDDFSDAEALDVNMREPQGHYTGRNGMVWQSEHPPVQGRPQPTARYTESAYGVCVVVNM